jgi:phosphoribosylanthranilate isomerase
MTPAVKICGLKTPEAVQAAKGADYCGFVFFPRSPRNITPENAAKLKVYASGKTVAVTVNADDDFLQEIAEKFQPDFIQLHGDETPERVAEVRKKFAVSVIKALPVRTAEDIDLAAHFEDIADILMFDAKPPGDLPGGNGIPFDWTLLAGRKFRKPYFLSGGISIGNVEKALKESGARVIDISSGLESSPGNKDPQMIVEFIKKVKALAV